MGADADQELRIRVTVTGDTSGGTQAEAALKGVTKAAGEAAGGAAKTATEMKGLGREVKEMSRLGHEAEGVLLGLERGGLGGLAQAGKNAGNIIKALATGTLGAVLIPVVIAAVGALALLKKQAEVNEEAIKKAFEDHAKAAEAYAKKLEEVKKASEKQLKEMVEQVEKLAAAYKDVEEAIDAAAKRQATLGAAQKDLDKATLDTAEKKALAKASTPEERAKISKDYAAKRAAAEGRDTLSAFDTSDLGAKVKTDAAQDAITKARQLQDEAEAKVRAAEAELAGKKESTRAFVNAGDNGINASPEAERARKDALVAAEALKEAKKNRDTVGEKTGAVIKEAQDQIDAAKTVVAETSLRRKAYEKIIEGKLADASVADPAKAAAAKAAAEKVGDTDKKIKDAKDEAFAKGGFGATADTGSLEKQRDQEADSLSKMTKAVVDDSKDRQAQYDQLSQQLKDAKERDGGG